MAYAGQQQIADRYGEDLLLLLAPVAAPANDPPAYPDDMDPQPVARALADAAGEIDAYVGRKYALPLPGPPPDVLTRLAADIAVYRLADTAGALTDERRRRYEDAVALLRRIASGEVSLGAPQTPPSAHGAVWRSARPRRFRRRERDGMEGVAP